MVVTKQQHQQQQQENHHFNDNTVDNNNDKTGSGDANMMSAESVAAYAKASLRHKFDHHGIVDPHEATMGVVIGNPNNRRSMATSPPPPSLANSSAAAGGGMAPQHSTMATFVRHLTEHQHLTVEQQQQHHHDHEQQHHPAAGGVPRAPSPILFTGSLGESSSSLAHHPNNAARSGHHMSLQMHPTAASSSLAGGVLDTSTTGAPTMDILIDPSKQSHPNKEVYLDTEIDRSSASNSDVDSESDDFSLDDSASDRSDGSDTAPASASAASAVYEPFSAARVIALNRMQQQQRLQQSRMQMLGEFRPPVDAEAYQSSDSIDSTLAEDSGESDSSFSDNAD